MHFGLYASMGYLVLHVICRLKRMGIFPEHFHIYADHRSAQCQIYSLSLLVLEIIEYE